MALKSDAAAEKPKDQLSRDFLVVRFSTFATISAHSGHIEMSAIWLLSGQSGHQPAIAEQNAIYEYTP